MATTRVVSEFGSDLQDTGLSQEVSFWLHNSGAIDVKIDGLSLKKNGILICWGCLSLLDSMKLLTSRFQDAVVIIFHHGFLGSNSASGVLEICNSENLWQWSWLEIRLNTFCWSNVPHKQFIIKISHCLYCQNCLHSNRSLGLLYEVRFVWDCSLFL